MEEQESANVSEAKQEVAPEGRYLYCVIISSSNADFGDMGIDDSNVYTIIYKDIGAVVHKCPAKAYDSKNEQTVKEWILAHQYIIDEATKKFGTVIPFSFDTIIKGDEEKVKRWLSEEYSALKDKLETLKDKAEYTVQIFCDKTVMMEKIGKNNPSIKKLKEDIKTKPKGVAYMLRQKMEGMLKDELRLLMDDYAKDFYNQIRNYADDIKVEQRNKPVPDKWKDKQMIVNLSCLTRKDKVEQLGKILGEINKKKEFSVRFTGPWAPFSFVGEIGGSKK
ncbi:MAG: GvpL/GvpF family gas vesicle protein [Thermoplasmatales archaeon]|nr:GvpL/GvpF family gas vesicle protein [Thermoplasmatales archaeon]